MLDMFRYGRILRVVRVLRVCSSRIIVHFLFRNRMHGTFSLVSCGSIILVIFGAISVLQLEQGVQVPKFKVRPMRYGGHL